MASQSQHSSRNQSHKFLGRKRRWNLNIYTHKTFLDLLYEIHLDSLTYNPQISNNLHIDTSAPKVSSPARL